MFPQNKLLSNQDGRKIQRQTRHVSLHIFTCFRVVIFSHFFRFHREFFVLDSIKNDKLMEELDYYPPDAPPKEDEDEANEQSDQPNRQKKEKEDDEMEQHKQQQQQQQQHTNNSSKQETKNSAKSSFRVTVTLHNGAFSKELDLPAGLNTLGRGDTLAINDKRCSRTQSRKICCSSLFSFIRY